MRCSILRLLCATLLLSATSIFLVFYLDLLPEHDPEDYFIVDYQQAPNFSLGSRNDKVFLPAEEPTDLPVIVWWTPLTPFQRDVRACPGGTCLITHSRTELTNPKVNVSAFMYYGTDFHLHDLPLPRQPLHLWVLLHEESPKNNWLLATPEGIALFNITATFSRYSDYPLHLHYLHTMKRLLQPMRMHTHLKSKGELGLVLFMQSACNPPSNRDSYVMELMKYISVDCCGKCLHNLDLPEHLLNPLTFGSEDVLDIVSKYKFVLSFENALCHDYFTEKFWRPLYAGSVPIVRGSPTIRDWDPSGAHPSIIVTEDFASPEALAKFLIELDKNDTEYNEYLKFKEMGVTNKRLLKHFGARDWVVDGEGGGVNFIEGFECFVCNKLHERREAESQRDSREAGKHTMIANSSHYDCLPPVPSARQGVKDSLEEKSRLELEYWVWNSKCAKERTVVASQQISMGAGQQELDIALTTACNKLGHP